MPDSTVTPLTSAAPELRTVWADRIEPETWQRFVVDENASAATLPPDTGDWLVSAALWLEHAEVLRQRQHPVGLLLSPQDKVAQLQGQLDGLALIAVDFPSFKEGQGFSHGRLLRTRLGWTGEMRAVGNVLIDIVHYLARCGFDSFTITPEHDAETAQRQLKAFTVHHQKHYRSPAVEMYAA